MPSRPFAASSSTPCRTACLFNSVPPPPPPPPRRRRAKAAGVKVVVSLQDAVDLENQQIDLAEVAAQCKALSIGHLQVATSDADEQELVGKLPGAVAAFARALEAAAPGAGYIHCNGGRGRAPTIVAAYLYWLRGEGLDQAVQMMQAARKSSPKVPVILAATSALLGRDAGSGELSDADRETIAAALSAA
jgi:protein-tyrosine phosphatase